jgi:hypothetical protein
MNTHTRNQNQKNKLKKRNLLLLIPLLLILPLLFTFCGREDGKTYYKIKGEGYIFDSTNNKPIEGATITVRTGVKGGGGLFGIYGPEDETFVTDANGYYQIRFIKKYKNRIITHYNFAVSHGPNLPISPDSDTLWFIAGNGFPYITLRAEEVKNAKQTFVFDTVKYYQKKFY